MVSRHQAPYVDKPVDGGFREFALALYSAEGVSRAALGLQDRKGVDVNVLLFAAYLATRGSRAVTRDDIETARRVVGPWQDDVVMPLRAVRRRLAAAGPKGAELSATVHDAELAAEFIELDDLAVLAGARGSGGDVRAALHTAVEVYAGAEPDQLDLADIAVLVKGAGG